ncbi:MAG: sigma factor-like helix-turn-helix DNA-binding protein [Desulfobacterales bacterium]|jgi:DNA-directed RNA polymerase sigma subunit (sigma70/sigma32)
MGSTSFCSGIKSSMNPEQTDSLYTQQIKNKMTAILESMDEMQRRVLQMRLGLIDGHAMTVDEVAAALSKSPQQVRIWEREAQKIMHHPELARRKIDR